MFWLNGKARDLALRAGGLRLMRELGRNSVRMLLYHRFPDACRDSLARQCAHLRHDYHVVSLAEVDRWLSGGRDLPPNSLVVTVDDGHRDFFRVAYPIFREYQVPVTMFLATGFIDRTCWLWGDRVMYMFGHTARRSVEVPFPTGTQRHSLESHALRQKAATAVKEAAKRMAHENRVKLVYDELPRLLNATAPENPPEEYEPLRWDEIREMAHNGMSFGAHTHTHPILSTLESADKLRGEIEVSKRRIEEELDLAVPHFSYPNGTSRDINPETIQVVKDAEFKSAVVAEAGLNRRSTDPYLLRRTTVEPESPVLSFGRDITRSLRS